MLTFLVVLTTSSECYKLNGNLKTVFPFYNKLYNTYIYMEKIWWFVIRKLISYVLLFSHLDFSVNKSKKPSDFLP